MARLPRSEVFVPEEVAILHSVCRVVRRCWLLGDDPVSGKNYDHRKQWVETEVQRLAAAMGIDCLGFAILSNHAHFILRSRPDVVATWDDSEVARRWLLACPARRKADGSPEEPNKFELNGIRHDPDKLAIIRKRLSDISWWMRLLCQRIAQRANKEDGEVGKFWQARFRAVRLLDETSLLACAAYVDLNPIRAAMAETLEASDHTSVQRRIQSLKQAMPSEPAGKGESSTAASAKTAKPIRADQFLAPLSIDERRDPLGPCANAAGTRCSDKGFLPMSLEEYLQLLDWTARQVVPGKRGQTPKDAPPILQRLNLDGATWCELVRDFGKLFYHVAGQPQVVEKAKTQKTGRRFHLRAKAREVLSAT